MQHFVVFSGEMPPQTKPASKAQMMRSFGSDTSDVLQVVALEDIGSAPLGDARPSSTSIFRCFSR